MVKPQFEVGPSGLTKRGIVKDDKRRRHALDEVQRVAAALGFRCAGWDTVPLLFADKNVEYLLHLVKPV